LAGRKVFTAGEVLQAADVNDFLMDQSVMVFAGTAARGSAIPSPSEGMVTYLSDSDEVEVFDGSVFKAVGPGKILQVLSVAKTDTFSTTSASFVDITDLSLTITPSSTSSKVLLLAYLPLGVSDVSEAATLIQFTGGNSGTFIGDSASSRTRVAGIGGIRENTQNTSLIFNATPTFLDSPATTSAVTYKVQMRRGSAGTAFLNRTGPDADTASYARPAASFTVMEVAG
jgi:hypothetical protein